MNDRLDFSIEGVKKSVENMKVANNENVKIKEAFLDKINNTIANEWTTASGQVAVDELRNFVNVKYQEYINFINTKIGSIENVVIPALNNINNA